MSEHTTQERAPASDYDRIGGASTIRDAVDPFHYLVIGAIAIRRSDFAAVATAEG